MQEHTTTPPRPMQTNTPALIAARSHRCVVNCRRCPCRHATSRSMVCQARPLPFRQVRERNVDAWSSYVLVISSSAGGRQEGRSQYDGQARLPPSQGILPTAHFRISRRSAATGRCSCVLGACTPAPPRGACGAGIRTRAEHRCARHGRPSIFEGKVIHNPQTRVPPRHVPYLNNISAPPLPCPRHSSPLALQTLVKKICPDTTPTRAAGALYRHAGSRVYRISGHSWALPSRHRSPTC
jgi:hypothetical protein